MAAALQDIAEIFFLDFVYVPDLLVGDDLGETSNMSLRAPPQREDFTIPCRREDSGAIEIPLDMDPEILNTSSPFAWGKPSPRSCFTASNPPLYFSPFVVYIV